MSLLLRNPEIFSHLINSTISKSKSISVRQEKLNASAKKRFEWITTLALFVLSSLFVFFADSGCEKDCLYYVSPWISIIVFSLVSHLHTDRLDTKLLQFHNLHLFYLNGLHRIVMYQSSLPNSRTISVSNIHSFINSFDSFFLKDKTTVVEKDTLLNYFSKFTPSNAPLDNLEKLKSENKKTKILNMIFMYITFILLFSSFISLLGLLKFL